MRTGSFRRPLLLTCLPALLATITLTAQADRRGLSLSQTRVVFNAAASSVTISLRNHGDRPWLIRAQSRATPDGTQAAPFMVTPPLFRLEPNSQSAIRILRQGTEALPTDRESVFYLSFLAIPSSPKRGTENAAAVSAQVTVGVDTVIKLFYRPAGLALTPQAAAAALTVHLQGNGVAVSNPTPYYQTLATFILDGKPLATRETGSMIAPFGSRVYAAHGQPRQASWSVLNDHGGTSPVYQTTVHYGELPQ
ncbi:molecular chaperone [Serratia fonticola]|uniref:fimbrial biogenesis chaperone n=1 Tax=Serratia fonticola TaxID=47917 RepID=UPI001AE9C661|nr:molecular chaperone [Serratia fonticola]MBP1039086.1 molecular chaperone [Serratia fonticola]